MTRSTPKILTALSILMLLYTTISDSVVNVRAQIAPKLYLSPASASVSTNDTLTLALREDSGSEPVNATSTHITFSPNKLEFLNITASSQFSFYDYSYGEGVININYQAAPTPVMNDQLVATIKFKVIAGSGSSNVTVDPIISTDNSSLISSESYTNILAAVYSGTYNITQPPQPSAPPPSSNPPTSAAEDLSDANQDAASPSSSSSSDETTNQTTGLPTAARENQGLQSGSTARLNERIIQWSAVAILVLASIFSFIYEGRIKRRRKPLRWHETVTDIATRLHSPNKKDRETVAEIAARINRRRVNPKTETVAELAARESRLAKKKSGHRV